MQQLRSEGLAEIHRHLNGNALPNLLWAYLVLPPYRLVPKELAGNVDGLQSRDCIALIRTAKDLRAALIGRLLRQQSAQTWNEEQQQDWNKDVLERLQFPYETLPVYCWDRGHDHRLGQNRCSLDGAELAKRNPGSSGRKDDHGRDRATFNVSGLPDYRDPAALLPFGEDEPLIGERAFLYHAFRLFHESADDAVLAAALHAYLVIQNLIWRALIQPRIKSKGFDRFDRYHSVFLRRPEKDPHFSRARDTYFHRLIQAQRTGGVRWLELRTTAFDGVRQEARRLEQALQRTLNQDIADRERELKLIRNEFSGDYDWTPLTTPGQQAYQLNRILEQIRANSLQAGLIFHFIKQADTVRAQEHDVIVPCRHSRLRCLVWKQAIDIRQVHRSRRYGRYIVGLDAANSELKARPEVFAPAIRWLREIPCQPVDPAYETLIRRFEPNEPRSYGLTFHVGEDFRHLLSGLRAVDEALRFLNMGPGDRIGHGLALGLSYKTWCERVGGEVAMPRGERLDDLVWLRERLAKEPGRFGRLLFAIDDKIRRLAWELYSPLIKTLEQSQIDWRRHADWELLQLALVDWQHLYAAWAYRGRDPLRYGQLSGLLAVDAEADAPSHQQVVQLLWQLYHFNPGVRARYEIPMGISLEDPDLDYWHDAVAWVQDELLHEIRDKRIAIEINPTSNLCIGPLQKMTEHPVFRWHPPEEEVAAIRPAILVGSDDPGVFGTELAFEYAALARAAEERGAPPRIIERWLRDLRDASKAYCFLNTT